MGKTFFSVMQTVQREIERGAVDSKSRELFEDLVSSVETCGFSNSDITKYICKNWRVPSGDLVTRWYGELGGKKSKTTFRSQISTASKQLFDIYGNIQPSTFGKSSTLSDEDKAIRSHLSAVIKSFLIEDTYAANVFISEVLNYFDDPVPIGKYDMSDCQNELKVLKLLAKTNIYNLLDTCDNDKLKYLLYVLAQPLTVSRTRSVNLDKLDILKQFGLTKTSYSMLNNVEDSASEAEDVPSNTVEVEEKRDHRFKLGIINEMADALEKRLEQPTTEEEMKFEASLGDKRDRYIQTLVGTLYAMTPEGFESYIRRQNSILLAEAINGDYQGFKGVDVDTTEFTKDLKSFIKYEKTE